MNSVLHKTVLLTAVIYTVATRYLSVSEKFGCSDIDKI